MANQYTFEEFQADILRLATRDGYELGKLRGTDIPQVDFGNKKLHGKHFQMLFPDVLADNAIIGMLIEFAAPGRPCAHVPFRKIVQQIKREHPAVYTDAIREAALV